MSDRLPELLVGADPCDLARRWMVREDVLSRVIRAATDFEQQTGRPVRIISGYRTPASQDRLRRQGRPTAANDRSTHLSCPATGVDVSMGFGITNAMKARWIYIATLAGLRAGGGSPVDPETGIPSDWNHVDVGPRIQ